MSRILVTGASGFIGRHVTARLVSSGHHVTVLARPGAELAALGSLQHLEVIRADLLERDGLSRKLTAARPDLCIHLAWYAEPGEYLHSPKNSDWVAASLTLLHALAEAGCARTIIAGTCLEYNTDFGDVSENTPLRPQTPYAVAKDFLRREAERFQGEAGHSLAWARIFYLYGPGEHPKRLVPMVIRNLLTGKSCPLTDGQQVRDYLDVRDVASAVVTVALSEISGPVNIGSGQPVTIAEVANEIARQLGRPDLLQFGAIARSAEDPDRIVANVNLLTTKTDWRRKYSLTEGLSSAIDWWRDLGGAGLEAALAHA